MRISESRGRSAANSLDASIVRAKHRAVGLDAT
jgi:hypothetical protein